MKISIIAAVAENYAIGKDNKLLCYLSADMKMFRELTAGHAVIMGKNTFESLPNGPLPKRKNIVLSSNYLQPHDNSFFVVSSLKQALELCNQDDEVFIIGGAKVYRDVIDKSDYLYITWIHHSFEDADTFFPEIDIQKWKEISRTNHSADEKNAYNYSFVKYERIR